MTGQTVMRTTMHASELSRPPLPVEVTVRVVQGNGGTLLTSGSFEDWPLFDLGTAAWPVVPQGRKARPQRLPLEDDWPDTVAALSGSATQPSLADAIAAGDAMARLESAANAGDERGFLAAKDAVDWEARPAADFLRAVQLALAAGAYMAARNLAARGAERFPNHSKLEKYARILAPPRVVRAPSHTNSGLAANRDWLMAHGARYRGQWVALRQGQLLAVGDTLDSVIAEVGGTDGILFTKVY